ncbi:MAG: hypothetical protein R3B84_16980 [Zavarzinella sp.]
MNKLYFSQVIEQLLKKSTQRRVASPRPEVSLKLESLDERVMPSVTPLLPEPLVSNTSTIGAGYSPQIIANPLDPLHLVSVYSTGGTVGANYSYDGGLNWSAFTVNIDARPNNPNYNAVLLEDPTIPTPNAPNQPYTVVSKPSVAFDTLGNIYIVSTHQNAANDSGVIALSKYSFTGGGAPVNVPLNANGDPYLVLHHWGAQDQAFNPTIAINTNLTTHTDPVTGATLTDSMANTLSQYATTLVEPTDANQTQIRVASSADFLPHPSL